MHWGSLDIFLSAMIFNDEYAEMETEWTIPSPEDIASNSAVNLSGELEQIEDTRANIKKNDTL